LDKEEAILQQVHNIAFQACDEASTARLEEQLTMAQNRLLRAKHTVV
jgi:hypothetical protein